MPDTAAAFVNASRRYLRSEYLPKIVRCVAALSEEDLWWRPNEVEHFSMHTGQIIYITKQRAGRDLAFYDATDGIARRQW